MAKHTRKALGSTFTQSKSRHTKAAQSYDRSFGSGARSKHTTKALGASRPAGQGSKGGGASNKSPFVGKQSQDLRYSRRNTSGRPLSR